MSEMKVSPSLQYDSKDLMASSYTLLKVLPLSGSQTGTVQINNGFDLTFELPPVAMNLSRSYLYFDGEVKTTGAGVYTWMHKNVAPIEAIEIMTRGGQRLFSLSDNANVYSQVVNKDIKYTEFNNNDEFYHPFAPSDKASGSQPQPGNGATGGGKSYADYTYCEAFNTTAGAVAFRQ